jgi:hypothetical protein
MFQKEKIMKYFYATRLDKNGDKLTTSYATEKSAIQYGGDNATISNGVFNAEIKNGDLVRDKDQPASKMPVLRSMLVNSKPATAELTGKYRVWAKDSDEDEVSKWFPTEFAFTDYGSANTLIKSLIGRYDALAIVETDEVSGGSQTFSDEAPF